MDMDVRGSMDVRAELTCGFHEWRMRDPWMMR